MKKSSKAPKNDQSGLWRRIGKLTAHGLGLRRYSSARSKMSRHYGYGQPSGEPCIENAAGVRNNDKEAVARVFEALTIAGVTMGLNKNTRPASGRNIIWLIFGI